MIFYSSVYNEGLGERGWNVYDANNNNYQDFKPGVCYSRYFN